MLGTELKICPATYSKVGDKAEDLSRHVFNLSGARGGTRTPTPLLASGPKPGASTNFATRACLKGKAGRQASTRQPAEIRLTSYFKTDARRAAASRCGNAFASDAEPGGVHRGQR